jgi:hypothetical protein
MSERETKKSTHTHNLRSNSKKTVNKSAKEPEDSKSPMKTDDSKSVGKSPLHKSQKNNDDNSVASESRTRRRELQRQQAAFDEELRLGLEEDKLEQQELLNKIKFDFERKALARRKEAMKNKSMLAAKLQEVDDALSDCSFESQDRDVTGLGEETLDEKMERSSLSAASRCSADADASSLEMMKQIIKLQPTHVGDFTGDEDYFAFRAAFKQLEKKAVYDNDELLSILLTHVKGEAKRSLTGILHGSGQYEKAWEILVGRYGNKTKITNVKLEALRKHPQVTLGNLPSLRDFIDALSAFMESMRNAGRDAELQSSLLIVDCLPKVPKNMIYSWNKKVTNGQVDESLTSFKEFLMAEEKIWEADPTAKAHDKNQDKNQDKNHGKKGSKPDRYTGVTVSAQAAQDCVLHPGKGHTTDKCRTFVSKPVPERLKIARKLGLCFLCLTKGHMTSTCTSSQRCAVNSCGKNHHELLHAGEWTASTPVKVSDDRSLSASNTVPKTSEVSSYSAVQRHRTLLGILPVKVVGPKNDTVINAFIDYGSNTTMINLDVAKKIGVVPDDVCLRAVEVTGVHGVGVLQAACVQGVQLQTINDKQSRDLRAVSVLAVQDLTGPSQQLNWDTVRTSFPNIDDYGLANVSAEAAQMIIGTDNLRLILYDHFVPPVRGRDPVLVHTALGYVLLGRLPGEDRQRVTYRSELKMNSELSHQVEEYFLLENLGVENSKNSRLLAAEDRQALQVIARGTRRTEDNKAFVSAMPWKSETPQLPNNREMALQRLLSLEKKLGRQPVLYDKYRQAIADDVRKGYIRLLSDYEDKQPSAIKWYLPHCNVVHKKKPEKFRRVYDCSAVFHGVSLNKQLLKGPNLLADLLDVMLRFREYPVAMAADLNEMYNQIRIPPDDQPCLQFLWRNSMADPVQTFQFERMLFGDVSAPARAVYVLKCIARDGTREQPAGARVIRDDMYLDDLMTSCSSRQEAVTVQQEARLLVEGAGFKFKKWVSNVAEVLEGIPTEDRAAGFALSSKDSAGDSHVLGVVWKVEEDSFSYEQPDWTTGNTKRQILSQLTSLWDPMGFLSPFVVRAKILVQELWKLKTAWDERVPSDFLQNWQRWVTEAANVSKVMIPRALIPRLENPTETSLQVFCDASQLAYGVVIYLRTVYEDKNIEVRFVTAKSRVAPQRPSLTIPRLELNAAVLAARLALKVNQALRSEVHQVDFWSDSSIVLSWLGQKTTLDTKYVVNRVIDIVDHLRQLKTATPDGVTWRHVETKENPSDDVTRGLSLCDMLPDTACRYWSGPDFLGQPRDTWPPGTVNAASSTTEASLEIWSAVQAAEDDLLLLKNQSSYLRAQRVTAFVNRFIHNCRIQAADKKRQGHLKVTEYQEAEVTLLIESQRWMMKAHETLQSGRSNQCAWMKKLQPFVKDGLLRVGGRLGKAQGMPYSVRHPVILDGNSKLAYLLVCDFHRRHGHAGPLFVRNAVAEKYYVTRLSWLVKKVLRQCVTCRKFKGKTFTPQMAELPSARVEPAMPFIKCGVDYFGPLHVKRGRSTEKVWGVIFTCFATRAVHLELADSLAADCFINVFRRFIGRRGEVAEIWSDNGTNLVGGERELREELNKLKKSGIDEQLAARQVSWHFNPPAASHFGGAWERLIRSVRKSLYHVMHGRTVTYSVLETALIEVEALLNSRPIVRVSDDVNDLGALTPGHFLILRPFTSRSFAMVNDKEVNARSAWRKVQALIGMFWKRWLREYLPHLRELPKWTDKGPNISEGDVVLLIESDSHRGQWPLGRIETVYPGSDGVVRVVDVKVNGTTLRRPVTKLSYVCGPTESVSYE